MRQRQNYSLYPRRMSHGQVVYYYRTYDEFGARTTGRSTGKTTKTAAHAYVQDLIRKDELVPLKRHTFESYVQDWWIWDHCPYIRSKLARGGKISRLYADIQRQRLGKYLLPKFGRKALAMITAREIDRWVLSLAETGLASSTVNHLLANLRVILGQATRDGLLRSNPAQGVAGLSRTDYLAVAVVDLLDVLLLTVEDAAEGLGARPSAA